jgi:hypothetical protein
MMKHGVERCSLCGRPIIDGEPEMDFEVDVAEWADAPGVEPLTTYRHVDCSKALEEIDLPIANEQPRSEVGDEVVGQPGGTVFVITLIDTQPGWWRMLAVPLPAPA